MGCADAATLWELAPSDQWSSEAHRQAGTSCDELKELGRWKTRTIVDRYAKFTTEHLRQRQSVSRR
jgi:hypothetical protein